MTTLHLNPAPRFLLSGQCAADLAGDRVTFRADRLENLASKPQQPVLQLWACPEAPDNEGARGTCVAEVSLANLNPGDAQDGVEARVPITASLEGTFHLVLAVAAAGSQQLWEDQRLLGEASFAQPHLLDPVRLHVSPAGIEVQLAGYGSPRDSDNVSGSLTLELWAHREPFAPDQPAGHCIGQLLQGTLNGRETRRDLCLRYLPADFSPDAYSLTLLLREWNGSTYLTRDARRSVEKIAWPLTEATEVATAKLTDTPPTPEATAPEAAATPPKEAVEPVIAKEAARDIAAEADSLHSEVATATDAAYEEGEATGKISFWKRFAKLFDKK